MHATDLSGSTFFSSVVEPEIFIFDFSVYVNQSISSGAHHEGRSRPPSESLDMYVAVILALTSPTCFDPSAYIDTELSTLIGAMLTTDLPPTQLRD